MILLNDNVRGKKMKEKCVIVGITLLLVFVSLFPVDAQLLRQAQSSIPIDGHGSRDSNYTLTLTTSGTGAGMIEATPGPYVNGTLVTIWANASIGSTFTGFSGDLNGTTTPQTLLMDGNKTVDAQFTLKGGFTLTIILEGSGSVLIDPDLTSYMYGQVVNLTAVPSPEWSFNHWGGNLTGATNPTNITMTDNETIIANFTQIQYTLTISIEGNGFVTKEPDQGGYLFGQTVNLTAVPDPGWIFDHWAGDLNGSQNPANITIAGNASVIANFTVTSGYILTITIEGLGNVTIDPEQANYTYGQVVNLTAVPDLGWSLDHWAGDLSGNTNPTTITMDGNKSVIANFSQDHYTLDLTFEGQGNVTKDPDLLTYVYGQVVNLTATADIGWTFDHWAGDLNGSMNPISFVMDGNKAVIANFTQIHYNLTITMEGQGNVTKDPDQPWYTYGQNVTLTAIAAHHWVFNHWGGDLNETQNPVTINITGNVSIIANFTFTNDPPVANDDSYNTVSGMMLVVPAPGVLGNDTDNDGDPLTVVLVNGTQGTLNLSSDGSFTYLSPLGFNGVDMFTYQAFDGFVLSNTATVMIIVRNESAPTIPDLNGLTYGKTLLNYLFTATATDPEGDQVWYQWDWGDGNTSDWLGPHASGETTEAAHNWESQGIYQLRVRAKDTYNFTSDWSDPFNFTMFQPSIMIGLVSNVTKGLNFTTFDPELTLAVLLPKITLPITGPGHMMVTNDHLGILRRFIIVGYFYALWIPDQ
jgi:hypothetical protein